MKKLLKSIGSAIWYFFIYFVMQLGISVIFIVICALQLGMGAGLKGAVPDPAEIERLLYEFLYLNSNFMLLISGLLTILTLILVFHARMKSFLAETGFAKVRIASLWPLIPMGLVLNILISSVIGMLPIPEEVLESYVEASKLVTSGSFLLQIINVAVVTPVVEEIIFRGLVFTRLKKGMPALIAAVLSAALFGVMHGQIIWMGYGFVVGLLFIAAFLKYRSLIAPILLHISFNASSFLLQALSPGETYSTILFILSAALTLALAVFIAIVRTEPLRGSMEGKERSDRKSFKRKTNTRRLFTRGASMKHLKAHRFIYSVLRPLVKIFLRFRFNMEWAAAERQKGPYILLANHNTDYDPLLVAAGLHEHMYFVASDHILRWKFAGKLLKIFFAPIARLKASTEARTVMDVINAVRDGANVCIFAEGIRSFNGETGEILSSTGKLVKRSGASLITYRIEGGYFTTPLWGHGIRRGRMRGYVKNIYGPEQLAKMSPDEVNRAIRDDLYVDEFALQRKDPVRYRGKNIAEHLEYALYACPACRRIGRMKSSGDVFGCECGFSVRYSEYGFFEGADGSIPPFENVLDWDRWQDSYMEEFIESIRAKPSSEPLFSDGGQSLFRFDRCGENKFEESGKLTMYRDRMELSGTSFALTGITNMTIHGGKVLIFSTLDGSHYEIKNEEPRSARKYLLAYRLLTNS